MSVLPYVACKSFSYSLQTLSCGMWDLVPHPGIKPRPPALGVWSFTHWTTREKPPVLPFKIEIQFTHNQILVFRDLPGGPETVYLRLGLEPMCWDSNLSKTQLGILTPRA